MLFDALFSLDKIQAFTIFPELIISCVQALLLGRETSLRIPDIHTPKAGFNEYECAHTKRSTVANDNEQRSAYRLCRHAEPIRMSEIRVRSCNSFFFFLFSLFPSPPHNNANGNAITRSNYSRMQPAYCR